MNTRTKWSAATAALLTIALVGGGASAASAAPGDVIKNPQSNGSKGSFYLFDENATLVDTPDDTRSRDFGRFDFVMASSDHSDYLSEIDPDDYAAAGTWDTVYKFVAKPTELTGGTGSWRAYSQDAAAGPNGGVLTANLTLSDFTMGNNGGIDSVFAADGDWLVGLAFTTNAGVTPVGMVYRTVTIDGDNDTYFWHAVEHETVVADKIVESELTTPELGSSDPAVDSTVVPIAGGSANANRTVKVAAFAGGQRVELGNAILDPSGNGTVDVAGKGLALNVAHKLFIYDMNGINEVLRGWDSFTLMESQVRTDTTDLSVDVTASGKFAIVAPASQSIDLGDVRRNQTSAPVALGAVTVFDDRDVLAGWNLNINSTAFTGPNSSSIAATALGYAPTGTALPAGITAGAAKLAGEGAFGVLAEGAVNSATGEFDGAVINTNLTFKAPVNAAKGTHTATLTLDLVSK